MNFACLERQIIYVIGSSIYIIQSFLERIMVELLVGYVLDLVYTEMYTLYVAICAVLVGRRPREIWWLEYVEETAGVYAMK